MCYSDLLETRLEEMTEQRDALKYFVDNAYRLINEIVIEAEDVDNERLRACLEWMFLVRMHNEDYPQD